MQQDPKVAVVIMNWNGKHFLEKFMPALTRSTYPNVEIIVGDNASADGSVDFIREQYPAVTIIENDKNYGFAGGYNRVLRVIEADYFVLLNSDVEVEPGWIGPVISLMDREPQIAAAQPLILSYTDKSSFEYAGAAGGFIDQFGYPFCRGRIFDTVEKNHGQYDTDREVFWASGAALFIRSRCWQETGGFDEDFFAHMEEIDLCWRLKIRGYQVFCCAASNVYHVGGGTLQADHPYKTYLNFRNNLLMLKKNLPPDKAAKVIFIRFFLDFISLLRFALSGKFKLAAAISRAHVDYLKMSRKARRPENDAGRYNPAGSYAHSIVWAYFAGKKKTFSSLKF